MKTIRIAAALFTTLLLVGCGTKKAPLYEGHASSSYMSALARGEYYLEMSMLYGDTIYSNKLATEGGRIESLSEIQSLNGENGMPGQTSVSHSLRLEDTTYFLDDENKVYFAVSAVGDNGLSGSIDYASAEYVSSGEDTLMTGSTVPFDEYAVSGKDGASYTLRLYTREDTLCAIVLSNGADTYEQDISVFSENIPDGMLKIPKNYTEISEDEYFETYYER